MPGVARIGDMVSCICCCHPPIPCIPTMGTIISGAATVNANSSSVARIGDIAICDCGHPTTIVTGSNIVITEGSPTARLGDSVVGCPVGTIVSSSDNVFAGEGGVAPNVQPGVTLREFAATINEDSSEPLTPTQEIIFVSAGIDIAANQLVDSTPIKEDVEEREPIEETIPSSCGMFPEVITGDYSLTTNFKVKHLTTGCAVSNYVLKNQVGLTTHEIACNLKNLSENVLEKLIILYGRPTINSGFRHGAGSSWHNKGCAVDLQWPGLSDEQYYQRCVEMKNTFEWCELILEWGGNRPWIHIAFKDGANNRTNFKTRTKVANTYAAGIIRLKNVPGVGGVTA